MSRPRRVSFEVNSEIPTSVAERPFKDLLAAGWAISREEPVAAGEAVGLGFTWYSRVGEFGSMARLPRPWVLIRRGLGERGAFHPEAHVYMIRSEVVPVNRKNERARLIVALERNTA